MKITAQPSAELTPNLNFLKGQISLWQYSIPYFMVVAPWNFAKDKFSLIEDIPESEREEWSLAELFQRDIDWTRIEVELVQYLKNESHPQFFNALTIALLPRAGDAFGAKYPSYPPYPTTPDEDLGDPIQIGGIQLRYFEGSSGTAGQIRWDAAKTYAVAVDGQHRLAAIKKLGLRAPADNRAKSSVPALILVPHKDAGMIEPPTPANSPRIASTLRRVFIDLNKHARDIPKARQILLDDEDIYRACLRRLVDDRLSAKPSEGRLPLALVDWISDKRNKIETGPFFTTVLLLEELVQRVLSEPRIQGPVSAEEYDLDEVDDELNQVESWLRTGFAPSDPELHELMSQVHRCYSQQVPITWLPDQIETLTRLFDLHWRPHLFRLFRDLKPYRSLWDYSEKSGFLRPEMVNLYAAREIQSGPHADARAQKIIEELQQSEKGWILAKNYLKPLKHIDEEIKDDSWPFMVVFQKALFRCYAELLVQAPWFIEADDDRTVRKRFTKLWVEAINALLESAMGPPSASFGRPKEHFWHGIGKKTDGTVDYTNAGTDRLWRWMGAWVCMYHADGVPTFAKLKTVEEYPQAGIRKLIVRRSVRKGMLALASAELPADASEAALEKAANERFKARYNHMRKTVLDLFKQ